MIWRVTTLWCLLQIPVLALGIILALSDINFLKLAESVKSGSFFASQKKQTLPLLAGVVFLSSSLPVSSAIATNYIEVISKMQKEIFGFV